MRIFLFLPVFTGILPDYHLKNFVSNLYKQGFRMAPTGVLMPSSHDSAPDNCGELYGLVVPEMLAIVPLPDGDSDVVFI